MSIEFQNLLKKFIERKKENQNLYLNDESFVLRYIFNNYNIHTKEILDYIRKQKSDEPSIHIFRTLKAWNLNSNWSRIKWKRRIRWDAARFIKLINFESDNQINDIKPILNRFSKYFEISRKNNKTAYPFEYKAIFVAIVEYKEFNVFLKNSMIEQLNEILKYAGNGECQYLVSSYLNLLKDKYKIEINYEEMDDSNLLKDIIKDDKDDSSSEEKENEILDIEDEEKSKNVLELENDLKESTSRINGLEANLDVLRLRYQDLKEEYEEFKKSVINEGRIQLFKELQSAKTNYLLDNLLKTKINFDNLKDSGWEIPENIAPAIYIFDILFEAFESMGLKPKILDEYFTIKKSDLENIEYIGSPLLNNEEKNVKLINSGWIYKDEIIISRPKVREIKKRSTIKNE